MSSRWIPRLVLLLFFCTSIQIHSFAEVYQDSYAPAAGPVIDGSAPDENTAGEGVPAGQTSLQQMQQEDSALQPPQPDFAGFSISDAQDSADNPFYCDRVKITVKVHKTTAPEGSRVYLRGLELVNDDGELQYKEMTLKDTDGDYFIYEYAFQSGYGANRLEKNKPYSYSITVTLSDGREKNSETQSLNIAITFESVETRLNTAWANLPSDPSQKLRELGRISLMVNYLIRAGGYSLEKDKALYEKWNTECRAALLAFREARANATEGTAADAKSLNQTIAGIIDIAAGILAKHAFTDALGALEELTPRVLQQTYEEFLLSRESFFLLGRQAPSEHAHHAFMSIHLKARFILDRALRELHGQEDAVTRDAELAAILFNIYENESAQPWESIPEAINDVLYEPRLTPTGRKDFIKAGISGIGPDDKVVLWQWTSDYSADPQLRDLVKIYEMPPNETGDYETEVRAQAGIVYRYRVAVLHHDQLKKLSPERFFVPQPEIELTSVTIPPHPPGVIDPSITQTSLYIKLDAVRLPAGVTDIQLWVKPEDGEPRYHLMQPEPATLTGYEVYINDLTPDTRYKYWLKFISMDPEQPTVWLDTSLRDHHGNYLYPLGRGQFTTPPYINFRNLEPQPAEGGSVTINAWIEGAPEGAPIEIIVHEGNREVVIAKMEKIPGLTNQYRAIVTGLKQAASYRAKVKISLPMPAPQPPFQYESQSVSFTLPLLAEHEVTGKTTASVYLKGIGIPAGGKLRIGYVGADSDEVLYKELGPNETGDYQFDLENLTAGTFYRYWVETLDSSGNVAAATGYESFTTDPDVQILNLTHPDEIQDNMASIEADILNIPGGDNATVELWYFAGGGAAARRVVMNREGDHFTYNLADLAWDTQYFYYIKVTNGSNVLGQSSQQSFTTSAAPVDTSPIIVPAG